MSTALAESSARWTAELEPSILVIEDDPAHAEAITRSLELLTQRYRVRIARSMHEAKLALSVECPALVLADLRLHDGDALDMLPRVEPPARPSRGKTGRSRSAGGLDGSRAPSP